MPKQAVYVARSVSSSDAGAAACADTPQKTKQKQKDTKILRKLFPPFSFHFSIVTKNEYLAQALFTILFLCRKNDTIIV
jgi:hypothetical protein